MYPTPNQHLKALGKLCILCIKGTAHTPPSKICTPSPPPPQNIDHFCTKVLLKNRIKDEKRELTGKHLVMCVENSMSILYQPHRSPGFWGICPESPGTTSGPAVHAQAGAAE